MSKADRKDIGQERRKENRKREENGGRIKSIREENSQAK